MRYYKQDFFISRIRAGYIKYKYEFDNLVLYIHNPDDEILYDANEVYTEAYDEGILDGMWTDSNVYDMLVESGIWSEKYQLELDKIVPGHIEYWQVELFNAKYRSKKRKIVRKYLAVAKEELNRLSNIRNSYSIYTIDGYASYIKNQYIIMHTTRNKDGSNVDWSDIDINSVMRYKMSQSLSMDQIRYLAHTTPWINDWYIMKRTNHYFNTNCLSDEQKQLISWSITYDSVKESSDFPGDEVLEDNDMLDGWFVLQHRKRDGNAKGDGDSIAVSDKINNADEVYIMADTTEDAKRIDGLNSDRSRTIKQQRLKQIREQGTVKEQQLHDVQQKRSIQMNKAYAEMMKNRRG